MNHTSHASRQDSSSSSTQNNNGKNRYTRKEREELTGITRSLRRVKRQLLLKEVEQPQNNVDNLRDLLIRVASTDNVYDSRSDGMWASSSSLKEESDIPSSYHLGHNRSSSNSSASFSSMNESMGSLHYYGESSSSRSLGPINEKGS